MERRRCEKGALWLLGYGEVERASNVVHFRVQPLQPLGVGGQVRLRLIGESEELLRMSVAQLVRLTGLLEPLGRELADRLEHPVARRELGIALAEQALVE